MEPLTPGGAARRERGRRKAALVTATAAVLGAAAVGAIGFGLSSASADTTQSTTGDSTGTQDQLQAPDSGLSSGSGQAHTGSGAS
ncbi:hypothetical protein [Amycolatopsis vastitatis]|uniref:Uncharacterized protein n=1 Tax=Amycolatopsis vastitatis TaxID=1905142 RepID=A0A229SN47_9PSEU|nr:hypothetical protein [Amycolatopsis vastitatis]OXM60306.1 hypothetical protein CF165_43570 [Amycolatopsis vastitatis]